MTERGGKKNQMFTKTNEWQPAAFIAACYFFWIMKTNLFFSLESSLVDDGDKKQGIFHARNL